MGVIFVLLLLQQRTPPFEISNFVRFISNEPSELVQILFSITSVTFVSSPKVFLEAIDIVKPATITLHFNTFCFCFTALLLLHHIFCEVLALIKRQ